MIDLKKVKININLVAIIKAINKIIKKNKEKKQGKI